MKTPAASLVRAVRRRGVRSLVRQSLAELRNVVAPNSTHVWYLLDLRAERPRLVVPAGYVVEELASGSAEVDLLEALGPNAAAEARTRFAAGGRLFVARTGDELAFACWVFTAIPTVAARGGWYRMRDDARGLEHSITVDAHRGRGLAPAAWSELCDALAAEGVTGLLTKVGFSNDASRRAVEKSGFVEIAHVTVTRRKGRIRVDVSRANGPDGARLERELTR
jgi:hypothetical protein